MSSCCEIRYSRRLAGTTLETHRVAVSRDVMGIKWVAMTCLWLLRVVKRNDDVKGWSVLPRRWIVERTFAWLWRNRHLSRDYERHCELSGAWIDATLIHLIVE
jgi:transposase